MLMDILKTFVPEYELIANFAKSKTLGAAGTVVNRFILNDELAYQRFAELRGTHLRLLVSEIGKSQKSTTLEQGARNEQAAKGNSEHSKHAESFEFFIFPDGPDLPVAILPSPDEVIQMPKGDSAADAKGDPDAVVEGTLRAFVEFARQKQNIAKSGLRVSGDPLILQRVQEAFKSLQFDWAGILGQYVGADIASIAENAADRAKTQFKHQQEAFPQKIKSLLQDETQLLPYREEFEDFSNGVFNLDNTLERLEARVRHLQVSRQQD